MWFSEIENERRVKIYNELKKAFGENHALELFDYFKVCMEMREQRLNDGFIDYSSPFYS